MKRFFSGIILFFLMVSQLQIVSVYAENAENLEAEKQKSTQTLDIVGQIVDTAVGKLDNKIRSEKKKDQLQEKNEEIKEYLAEVSEDIQ